MAPSDRHGRRSSRAIRSAWPARCTTAPLSAGPPPMKAQTPATPSLPTMATSTDVPSRIVDTSDRWRSRENNVPQHDARLVQHRTRLQLDELELRLRGAATRGTAAPQAPGSSSEAERHLPCDLSWPRGSPRRSVSGLPTLSQSPTAWRLLHPQPLHRQRHDDGFERTNLSVRLAAFTAVFLTRAALRATGPVGWIASLNLSINSAVCIHGSGTPPASLRIDCTTRRVAGESAGRGMSRRTIPTQGGTKYIAAARIYGSTLRLGALEDGRGRRIGIACSSNRQRRIEEYA